jgi:hypothetical protein
MKAIEVQIILYTERFTPIDPKTGLPDLAKEKAHEEKAKEDDKKRKNKHFKGLEQVHVGTHILTLPIIMEPRVLEFFNIHLQKLLTISEKARGHKITDQENEDFNEMTEYLTHNEELNDYIKEKKEGYIVGYYLLRYNEKELKPATPHNPTKTKLKNAQKLAINYRYTHTEVDLSKDTFKKALDNKNYVVNECWLNTLYDFYKDTLLSPTKQRYRITRQTLLEILGKTEDNIKEGLTVEEVLPFFVKYKLKLRVFDMFYKPLFTYDPPNGNRDNKALYCMVKGDHVYTLNHDVKTLQQHINNEKDQEFIVQASSNYMVKERVDVQHYMIETIDDILKYLSLEDEELFFIHKYDNLMELMFNLLEAKYEPKIRFECGRITWIFLILNKKRVSIRSQMMITSVLEGQVQIEDIDVYNNMFSTMNSFNNKLFNKHHKSHYTPLDMEVLDNYRTVANVGMLADCRMAEDMVEIDVSKAFTAAFSKIKKIPVFNEFDSFTPYDNSDIEDLSLYIIKATRFDLFLNKTYNLCYGMFLKNLTNIEIIAFKQPSLIQDVKYSNMVNELYNNIHISDEKELEIYILRN